MEVPLDIKIIYINENIACLDEKDISQMYDKIRENVQPRPKIKKPQNKIVPNDIKKVSKSKSNVKVIESNKIDNQNPIKTVQSCNQQSKKTASLKVIKPIDDEDISDANSNDDSLVEEKNTLILKYVNGLLKNAGKDEIYDLTEFRNIDRSDIVLEGNVKYLEAMSKELFKLFDKSKCRYYPKTAKSRPLNVLRGMIKDTKTYRLVALNTEVYEIINKCQTRRAVMLYTIQKNI